MRRFPNSGLFLIAGGMTGMAVSALADAIGIGRPGLGLNQLAGLVIGAFVTMVGLGKVLLVDTRNLARISVALYASGIFYLGLRPFPSKTGSHGMLLSVAAFHWRDFMMNTVGFVFLGYLLMLSLGIQQALSREDSLLRRVIIAVAIGGVISLFLEVSQYYIILGRDSNLIDLIANVFGTFVGIAICVVLELKRASGVGIRGIQKPGLEEKGSSHEG